MNSKQQLSFEMWMVRVIIVNALILLAIELVALFLGAR